MHKDIFDGYKRIVGRILRQDLRSPYVEFLFCGQPGQHAPAAPARHCSPGVGSEQANGGSKATNFSGAGLGGGDSSALRGDPGPETLNGVGKAQSLKRAFTNKSGPKTQEEEEEELEEMLNDERPEGQLTEAMMIRLTSFALLAGVLAVHLAQTLQLSTKVGYTAQL